MLKCILIYLWIYIGLYYAIDAAGDDEHVHIKFHMPSGQRKHTHHQTYHHKKRQPPLHYHSATASSSSHRASPPPPPPHLYDETPHNYLTGITTTPQHHLHHTQQHIKKLPSSHLHESGQLLEAADVFSVGANHVDDAEEEEPMMIPSYLADNFALFPQPTTSTTYETKMIPQNSQGFHHVVEQHEVEEDNEIRASGGGGVGGQGIDIMMAEEAANYHRHKPYAEALSSSKTIKSEQQLLQQIMQQQHQEQQQQQREHEQYEQEEIMNTAGFAAAKLRGNKYKAEKEYHSEDDMTETMMYSSSPHLTTTFAQGTDEVGHSSGIKALTVDDIWSQLQRQYLNKYTPQAQSLAEADSEGGDSSDAGQKYTNKQKRTTQRHRHIKTTPSTALRQSTSSHWPAKTLNYENNQQQQQSYYDDIHSSFTPSSPSSSSFSTSSRDTDLFDDTRALSRPYNNFNAHNTASGGDFHGADEGDDDDISVHFNYQHNVGDVDEDDDDDNISHNTSFEETVYQRGKKYAGNTGHVVYSNSNTKNNPFNYHNLYAAYSTPITATVATKIQPSTYHPKLATASTSSSSSVYDKVSPTLPHESTSYQWHTQQHNPDSHQSYHSHQQQQQQQPPHQKQQQHYYRQHHPQSSALRLPKATLTQMPGTVSTVISSTSSLSPTLSNEFTSSSAKSTVQPSRYKKRKNRTKSKRNRIVVV